MTDTHTNTEVSEGLQVNLLIQEDVKVLPFADVRAKAAPSAQLF